MYGARCRADGRIRKVTRLRLPMEPRFAALLRAVPLRRTPALFTRAPFIPAPQHPAGAPPTPQHPREPKLRAPSAAIRLLELGSGTPDGINGPAVTQAAREGDAGALSCFESIGSWLGHGLADLAAILDPGCFVIGGGVSEAGEMLLGPARAAYESSLTGRAHRKFAEVRLAELGPDAGLIGAADLARIPA